MPYSNSSKTKTNYTKLGQRWKQLIPINEPSLGREEERLVRKVLNTGLLTTAKPEGGPQVQALEKAFAEYVGVEHAVAVSSGTAALEAALYAANVGPGDEVIVPSLTFVATANAVTAVGARPVFADVNPLTLQMDPYDVKKRITRNTKAIIPVHLYGRMADMHRFNEMFEELIIEDASQALGSTIDGVQAGSFGDMGCFSLYGAKIITAGEGGIITTNSEHTAETLRGIRNHGLTDMYSPAGHNFRMTELHAAVANAQLPKLDKWITQRQSNYSTLLYKLSELTNIEPLPFELGHNGYLFTLQSLERDGIQKLLLQNQIGATIYYNKPIHHYPFYKTPYALPNTDRAAMRVLSLPIHPSVTETDIERMAKLIRSYRS